MPLRTRLTDRLGLRHPIILAPMGGASGGRLAAAVSNAGGLGMIGAGSRDVAWLDAEFAAAGAARIGCGFITWVLARQPHTLHAVLAHHPAAIMLSLGDPAPFAAAIHAAGTPLICQVQSMDHARAALDAGAGIIVAQGAEAGGHGATRATMTLVPEIADLLAERGGDTLLIAAGGIADGRGIAAALMLGADGVLIGSRFWLAAECLTHPNHQHAVLARDGDATVRQLTVDIAWGMDFPPEFTGRILRNAFVERWTGHEAEHRAQSEALRPAFMAALMEGRSEETGINIGEAIGLVREVRPAAEIVRDVVAETERHLRHGVAHCVP